MPTNMAISIRWARIVVLNVHVAIESGSPISIYIYIYYIYYILYMIVYINSAIIKTWILNFHVEVSSVF